MAQPASVAVRSNRSTKHGGGATVAAVANFVPLDLGANKLIIEQPQMSYEINNPKDQQNIPNTLEVMIIGNDFSGNRNFGIRSSLYPPFYYALVNAAQPLTGTLNVTVRDNTLTHNDNYGIVVDAGFPNRNNSRRHTGTIEATFQAQYAHR